MRVIDINAYKLMGKYPETRLFLEISRECNTRFYT